MTRGPSRFLSWRELACKDGTPYPAEWRADRAVALAAVFEALRAAVGGPLVVLSAYRTPAHNRFVGGARNSQHVQGRALDLAVPAGWTVDEFADLARRVEGVGGVGIYPTFVHVDTRPKTAGRVVVWWGRRPVADGAGVRRGKP